MFPVKVETRILLNCPNCCFNSRYDTGFLEDAIHDGKEISCVACGCHFEIVVRKVEAAQQSMHPTWGILPAPEGDTSPEVLSAGQASSTPAHRH